MTPEEKQKLIDGIINGDTDKIPEKELTEEERHDMIRSAARKILERMEKNERH